MTDGDGQTFPKDGIPKKAFTSSKRLGSPDAYNLIDQTVTADGHTGTKKPRNLAGEPDEVLTLEKGKEFVPKLPSPVAKVGTSVSHLGVSLRSEPTVSSTFSTCLAVNKKDLTRPPLRKMDFSILQGVDSTDVSLDNAFEGALEFDIESIPKLKDKPVLGGSQHCRGSCREKPFKRNITNKNEALPLGRMFPMNGPLNYELSTRARPNQEVAMDSQKSKLSSCNIQTTSVTTNVDLLRRSTSDCWTRDAEKRPVSHVPPKGSHSLKRKFPGPAGALPKLSPHKLFGVKDSLSTLIHDKSQIDGISSKESIADVAFPVSQSFDDHFQKEPWMAMKRDFSSVDENGQCLNALRKFTIEWVLRKAARRRFATRKVPLLCVLLNSIQNTESNVSAIFQDPTGKIIGTICGKLMEKFASHIEPGCVFVLRQIGVFSPSPKKHYLNITLSNVVRIYGEDDQGVPNCYHLSAEPWCDVVKEASQVAASPFHARQSKEPVPVHDARLSSILASLQMNSPSTTPISSSFENSSKNSGCMSSWRSDLVATGPKIGSSTEFTPLAQKPPNSTKAFEVRNELNASFHHINSRDIDQSDQEGSSPKEQLTSSTVANSKFKFRSFHRTSVTSSSDAPVARSHSLVTNSSISVAQSLNLQSDDVFGIDDELDSFMESIDVDSASQS